YELHIGDGLFTNGELQGRLLVGSKSSAGVDAKLVEAGDEADDGVAAGVVNDDGALGTSGEKSDSDSRAANSETLRVGHRAGKSSGVDLGHGGSDAQKNCHCHTENYKRKQWLALHTEPPWNDCKFHRYP